MHPAPFLFFFFILSSSSASAASSFCSPLKHTPTLCLQYIARSFRPPHCHPDHRPHNEQMSTSEDEIPPNAHRRHSSSLRRRALLQEHCEPPRIRSLRIFLATTPPAPPLLWSAVLSLPPACPLLFALATALRVGAALSDGNSTASNTSSTAWRPMIPGK